MLFRSVRGTRSCEEDETHLPPVHAIATSARPSLSSLAACIEAPATSNTYSGRLGKRGQSSSSPNPSVLRRLRGEGASSTELPDSSESLSSASNPRSESAGKNHACQLPRRAAPPLLQRRTNEFGVVKLKQLFLRAGLRRNDPSSVLLVHSAVIAALVRFEQCKGVHQRVHERGAPEVGWESVGRCDESWCVDVRYSRRCRSCFLIHTRDDGEGKDTRRRRDPPLSPSDDHLRLLPLEHPHSYRTRPDLAAQHGLPSSWIVHRWIVEDTQGCVRGAGHDGEGGLLSVSCV